MSASLSGHEDWVKSLAFQQTSSSQESLLLASGSQDATIRLWNIEPIMKKSSDTPANGLSDDLLDAFEASLANVGDAEEGGRQISLKRHILTIKTGAGRRV